MADNILQQVTTFNESSLPYLLNQGPFLNRMCNKKFDNFETRIFSNLGSSVSFDEPSRGTFSRTLVPNFQSLEQKKITLSVDEPYSASVAIKDEEMVFNFSQQEFMERYGKTYISEIGTGMEISASEVCETTPYRFYGDGVTQISSINQLNDALVSFRNTGAAMYGAKGVIDDFSTGRVVNSNLSQFTPIRNDEQAQSWEIGEFSRCEWYKSNLLPIHDAGTEGEADSTLTVVSFDTNAEGQINQITFSGANQASDPDSIKKYDSLQFIDDPSAPIVRWLTDCGHARSASLVQFQATEDSASDGSSQVTVNITPPLQAASGREQNISRQIEAGMKVKVLPSHRCGVIMSGNPLFIAMPKLNMQHPFSSSIVTDDDTGASLRLTYGTLLEKAETGFMWSALFGKVLVPRFSMKIAIPLSSGV